MRLVGAAGPRAANGVRLRRPPGQKFRILGLTAREIARKNAEQHHEHQRRGHKVQRLRHAAHVNEGAQQAEDDLKHDERPAQRVHTVAAVHEAVEGIAEFAHSNNSPENQDGCIVARFAGGGKGYHRKFTKKGRPFSNGRPLDSREIAARRFRSREGAVQEGHSVTAVAGAVGIKDAVAVAGGDLVVHSPENGVVERGMLGLVDVREVQGAVNRGVVLEAVQEGHDLRAGAGGVGRELAVAGAGGDALLGGPDDRLHVVGVRGGVNVSELVGAAARRGRIGGAPQEGDDLRAGAALLRGEGGGGSALGDVKVDGPLDGIIEVVAGSHIDKVHGLLDLDGERTLSLLAGLGAVGGEGDIDDIADLGKLGGHIGHVVEVIVLAAGLGVVVELVLGADGGVDAGAAVVVTVERAGAVEVGGDGAVLAHIEGDIVEVSLLVALVGIAQEVDELVGAELDRAVHADLKDNVFLDNGDHNLAGHADLLVDDLVVLVVLLGIQGEGNLDGVLGLGNGLEGHLVEIFNLSGGLDLVLALVEDTLSGGVGQGVELNVVELEVVALAGLDVVIGVVVHEGLESLLVEGERLAGDHIVLDGVGLLGNFDRTGGSDVVIDSDNIQRGLAISVERAGGNSVVLVLGNRFPISGVVRGSAPVAVIHVGLETGAALIDVEVIVIAVGEGHRLVAGRAGHGVLDFALAVDSQVHGNNIIVVDLELEAGITNVSLVSVDGDVIVDRAAVGQRSPAILEGDAAGRTNNSDGIDIVVAEAAVLLLDRVNELILDVGQAVTIALAIDDGSELRVQSRDVHLIGERLISFAIVGNSCRDSGGSGFDIALSGNFAKLIDSDKVRTASDFVRNCITTGDVRNTAAVGLQNWLILFLDVTRIFAATGYNSELTLAVAVIGMVRIRNDANIGIPIGLYVTVSYRAGNGIFVAVAIGAVGCHPSCHFIFPSRRSSAPALGGSRPRIACVSVAVIGGCFKLDYLPCVNNKRVGFLVSSDIICQNGNRTLFVVADPKFKSSLNRI